MATNCTGYVKSVTDHKDVPTDSWQGRYCDVTITRCTACAGSAHVVDHFTGDRWLIDLPSDYRHDDQAAYWAVEVSLATQPVPRPVENPTVLFEDTAEFEYIEDEDGSEAYARMLERQAERGTWFGSDPF